MLHYLYDIIPIGPIIEEPVVKSMYYVLVINTDNYGVTEIICLPIIGTENGPFRLVGDRYITNSFSFIISTM